MEVLAQSVFRADMTGKGELSSLLTKPLRNQGEKVGGRVFVLFFFPYCR